jgi:toxin ParE1/3/4
VAYRVNLTNRAVRDLERLYDSIHASTGQAAFEWFNKLVDTIYSLDHLPERGTVNPKNETQRQLFFGDKPHIYKIVYNIDTRRHTVTVVVIRHGTMLPPAR